MKARTLTATAHDLARFHAERAATYRVLADVVGVPPTRESLHALHEMLEEAKQVHNVSIDLLIDAVEEERDMLVGQGPRLCNGSPDVRCLDPESSVRGEAFRTAGECEDGSSVSDLIVLAHLAEKTSFAIRQCDFVHAGHLSDLQRRFLEEHGAICLERLAASLVGSDFEPYVEAGRVLEKRVSQDLVLLDVRTRSS